MACTIATVSGDKRFRLGNSELLWKFGFGTDWVYIRVAFLYCVNMAGSLPAAQFLVGVNSGTQFGFRSSNCVEYVGAQLANGASGAFTYVASAPTYFNYGVYNVHYKVGSVDTISSNNSSTFSGSANPAIRTYLAVDFWKRSSSGLVTTAGFMEAGLMGPSPAPSSTDCPSDFLYRFTETDQLPWSAAGFGNYAGGPSNVTTIAYNGPYSFDSLSLSWNDNTNTVEISELMVVRFA